MRNLSHRFTEPVTDWKVGHAPGNNTRATATKAAVTAPVGGYNICTALSVSFVASSTAPTAVNVTVAVIDGASDATDYLWGPHDISLPAVAGAMNGFALSNLWIKGSATKAMTIEFSAAGGNNTKASVWMSGTVQ